MKPYNWQSHNPRVEIPRRQVERVAETLHDGGSAVVLGGRGMGKSVFLRQLRTALEARGDVRVVLISAPPPELSARACLDHLARYLKAPEGVISSQWIFADYFARNDVPEHLVLLFDEFDRYAAKGERGGDPPGRGFFNDLEASRRDIDGLGILATGSLGVFVVRDVLGSSFLARALHLHLEAFDRAETSRLAGPFAERGEALSEEVLDALHLAAGGIPALLTFGLQQLWRREKIATERDVARVYARFRDDHGEYLTDLLQSVADPRLSEAPQRVLELIRQADEPLRRPILEEACKTPDGPLALQLVDVLRLLQAAGLVRLSGSAYDDPIVARPISGILDLPMGSRPGELLREHLLRDLETLLGKLHRASADFFRPGPPGSGKRLVPESVFAAYLALGFGLQSWNEEREAQSAAGRTDLKLRRNASPETVVVEVKIWGRPGAAAAQRQIERYWTTDVVAGAVVQITDRDIPDWPEKYRRQCLDPLGMEIEEQAAGSVAVRARFSCVSSTADGITTRVDHHLVRLPRR